MKTAGVIGGLGPETTSDFYMKVIEGCYEKNKENRPPLLLWNVPIEYKTKKELIEESHGEERYLPYLTDAAQKLKDGGADFLVMPCNTLHIFIDDIDNSTDVPVISIVEEAVKTLKEEDVDKVGLLATPPTIQNKLYQKALEREGIECFLPSSSDKSLLGDIISRITLSGASDQDKDKLLKILDKFKKEGVEDVLLACTDLQLLISEHPELEIYDTMKILADSTVEKILE